MFTTHFKMTTLPFCERIPAQQIMKHDLFSQGLARLQYMMHQGAIALIYGQTGVGKSTLIKLLLNNLANNQYLPIYIYFTNLRASSLFTLIVNEFGETPKHTKDRLFLQIMEKIRKSNLTLIFIIDEAHLLDNDSITDLRLLVSSPMEDVQTLKIILCGQEGIKRKLKKQSHSDFFQRISVLYHLKPFSKTQTSSYIDFQMKSVDASEKIFDQDVKNMIHEYSNGIPRQINNIATGCLINTCTQNLQKVNLEILNQTITELQLF